jgi:uncharacterized protein
MQRRAFLSALAASALPAPTWASVGNPSHIACARAPGGDYLLAGLHIDGTLAFTLPLPARGHAGAAHPTRAQAVIMARRPGSFMLVLECKTGRVQARLTPPEGLQFNGHAAYLADGMVLATAEQQAKDSAGRVGLWDTLTWQRIGSWDSGGLGPHDLLQMPDGGLVVANGGIATDPTDRRKLNLETMRPNLTYLDQDGRPEDRVDLPELRQNSIRHLALRDDRLVAFAMQWEGSKGADVPLLGLHRKGSAPILAHPPETLRMQGYAGSVAWSGDGASVLITSPRGGVALRLDATGRLRETLSRPDICGAAPLPDGLLTSDGGGALIKLTAAGIILLARYQLAWDNHIVDLQ